METGSHHKLLIAVAVVLAALALPLALMVTGGWKMWTEYREQGRLEVEHKEALKASLERAADVAMPVPHLSEEVIVRDVPIVEFEAELQRVVRLANGVGGTAASWNDGESVRIVANVPKAAESLFRESLERGVYDIASAGESKPLTIVQVVLRPVEPPKNPSAKKR
ncbi:MAG: hypothetical protein IAE97_04170 [Chthoniobacterales bacterium]|nr:hypothetical protein [Chthoniobacterales bacterium]